MCLRFEKPHFIKIKLYATHSVFYCIFPSISTLNIVSQGAGEQKTPFSIPPGPGMLYSALRQGKKSVRRRRMVIGIDTFMCDGGKSGIGVYLTNLLKRLPRSEARFELFGWEFDRYAYTDAIEDIDFISQGFRTGLTANSLWHLYKYPEFARSRNYGACFFPAAHKRLPQRSPCPTLGTIHDMTAYTGPRRNREHLGAVLRMVLPNSLRNLDRIIAVSGWVKQELVEVVRIPESRIEVVPNGIDLEAFYPRPRNEESVVLIQPLQFPSALYPLRFPDRPSHEKSR